MAMFDGHIKNLCEIPADLLRPLAERLADLTANDSGYWERHDLIKPNKFGPFYNNTQHVVLAFPARLWRAQGARYFDAWSDWRDVVEPVIAHVTAVYGYKEGRTNRIMLARLLPGRVIGKHIDSDDSSELPHKIHVPLATNPRVEFWEEDRVYHLRTGQAYEVNNRIIHGGANYGEEPRVHLIFDYFDGSAISAGDELERLYRASLGSPS
ncbi:MAG TPA: aspartyl/asparaginyl beta-hydroxylase domain-containing protein [Bdellovibrionales bacterium]|nr:aspartyl/asparaginyl beta-hydroxylase domain-containing protein [Bdellovibrionales bacterium]